MRVSLFDVISGCNNRGRLQGAVQTKFASGRNADASRTGSRWPRAGRDDVSAGIPNPQMSSQIAFVGPEGMSVVWDVTAPGQFDSEPLICPGRYNFPQGAIYQLKITNIPGRPGVELYPTLEVGPAMPRSEAFLAHNAIPVQFTEEDFDQVLSGNFVTKVIYLPDPEFQELAVAGVETLVSTRLDPGVDPIVEADRRGAILAIVRVGNKDLQLPAPTVIRRRQRRSGCLFLPDSQRSGFQFSGCRRISADGNGSGAPNTMPNSNYISGVTAPQYGMPMCGTPIGLPGPPHVPLGNSRRFAEKHYRKPYARASAGTDRNKSASM